MCFLTCSAVTCCFLAVAPCRLCLEARDPYCGWDRKQRRCTTIEDSSNMSQWSQNITECPVSPWGGRNCNDGGGFSCCGKCFSVCYSVLQCNFSEKTPPSFHSGAKSVSTCDLWIRVSPCMFPNPAPYFLLQVRNLTVNGGFGPWAPWQPCSHDDGDSSSSCLCRLRPCDSPAPRCGGRNCEGPTMEVSNCSR